MALHPRRKTCLYERLTFLWLRSAGLSIRSIARRSGRSPDTVRRWLLWWKRYGRLLGQVGIQKGRLFPVASTGSKVLPCRVKTDTLLAFPSNVIPESCAEETVPIEVPTPLQWVRGAVPQYTMLEQLLKAIRTEPNLGKTSLKKILVFP